jgi:hypothetical protein
LIGKSIREHVNTISFLKRERVVGEFFHLFSNKGSNGIEGSPYLATCNNKDSFCLMMLSC